MSKRENRPKVSGGFNPLQWYQENKNKVTKITEDGFVIEDPAAKPEVETLTETTPVSESPVTPAAITGNPYGTESTEELEKHNMYIWAKKHETLAKRVKPGAAGYEAIQRALGRDTQASAYNNPFESQLGNTSLADIYTSGVELKSGVEYKPDFEVDLQKSPQDFLQDRISLLKTSASSLQQPNFNGTSEPIGGDSPKDPQPVQDFNNANKNPAEVIDYGDIMSGFRMPKDLNFEYNFGK